jgi:carboxylesterase
MADDKEFILTKEGHEKAVLLFHGLTGSPGELYRFGLDLFDAGYDVYCPVLPGHCQDAEAIKLARWEEWHAFALKSFDELAGRYQAVYLSGICLGSVLALSVASERKTVRGMAALSSTFFLDGWSLPPVRVLMPLSFVTIFKFLYAFPEKGPMGVKNRAVRRQVEKSMNSENAAALNCFPLLCVYELSKLARFVRKRLHQVTIPVIIIHSNHDDLASMKNAHVIDRGVKSVRKEMVVLLNSYHLITLDNEKDVVSEKTIAFFRSLDHAQSATVHA